jgi:hypothetical protein
MIRQIRSNTDKDFAVEISVLQILFIRGVDCCSFCSLRFAVDFCWFCVMSLVRCRGNLVPFAARGTGHYLSPKEKETANSGIEKKNRINHCRMH